jgi:hypothetical protein
MKTILTSIIALGVFGMSSIAATPAPPAPTLQEVLKRANPQVVIFQPTTISANQTLKVTHVRMGDGSVRPGAAVQLVVYATTAVQGEHQILAERFHVLSKEGSPVNEFSFTAPTDMPANTGIIAILIGLLQPSPNSPVRPTALPPQDLISAQITDGSRIGLLLPAVQKVRSAAAR